jgi:hypothetical protein
MLTPPWPLPRGRRAPSLAMAGGKVQAMHRTRRAAIAAPRRRIRSRSIHSGPARVLPRDRPRPVFPGTSERPRIQPHDVGRNRPRRLQAMRSRRPFSFLAGLNGGMMQGRNPFIARSIPSSTPKRSGPKLWRASWTRRGNSPNRLFVSTGDTSGATNVGRRAGEGVNRPFQPASVAAAERRRALRKTRSRGTARGCGDDRTGRRSDRPAPRRRPARRRARPPPRRTGRARYAAPN